jgi:hypothetical protein
MPLKEQEPIKTRLDGYNCITFIHFIFGFSIIYPDYIWQLNIIISIFFLMMILFKCIARVLSLIKI